MTRKHAFPALLAVLVGSCTPIADIPPPYPHRDVFAPPGPGGDRERLERVGFLLAENRLGAARRALAELMDSLVVAGGARSPDGDALLSGCLEAALLLDVLSRLAALDPFPGLGEAWWRPEDLHHPEVKAWKAKLLADGGRGLRRWVGQAGPYYGDILAAIESAGLPPELWVLTIVESGFRLRAVSRAKAVGPWQFMANTARHCGLLITTDRDERRDWVAATDAACRYLNELKEDLGDGLLALAAFNCGPSRVRRELAAAASRSFWDLKVPPETRKYVPRVLALIDILGNGGNTPYRVDGSKALAYEELEIPYTVEVEHLAEACGVAAMDLFRMNPAWLLSITPADGRPVRARIPKGKREPLVGSFEAKSIPRITVSPGRMYEVRRGDTLWDISQRFRVSLRTLLKVNGLTGKEVIHPGREIRLPG